MLLLGVATVAVLVLGGLGAWRGAHWCHDRAIERRIDRYSDSIWRYAQQNSLPTGLVRAVIRAESGGDPTAVSSKGARGLMQIMPAAEEDALLRLRIPKGDLFDPDYNIRIGTTYLRILSDRFDDDPWLTLSACNMGPTRVQRIVDANPGRSGRELVEEFAPPVTVRYCRGILGVR